MTIITRRGLLRGLGALPLISPALAQNLYLRNPLAFPAGVAPGFDPSHVAAKGVVASCYPASGGNVLNLFGSAGFQKGTPGAAVPTTKIDAIGPVVDFGTSSTTFQSIKFNRPDLGTIGAGQGLTFGAIFRVNGTYLFNNSGIQNSGNAEGLYQAILGASGNFGVRLYGIASFDSGVVPVVDASYFYAASVVNLDGTTWNHNHVIVRLDTGTIQAVAAGPVSPGTVTYTNNNFIFGGIDDLGSIVFPGIIAATMFSTNPLSLAELQEWAADPWAFWYPSQNLSMLVGLNASGRFRSLIGVGQ